MTPAEKLFDTVAKRWSRFCVVENVLSTAKIWKDERKKGRPLRMTEWEVDCIISWPLSCFVKEH